MPSWKIGENEVDFKLMLVTLKSGSPGKTTLSRDRLCPCGGSSGKGIPIRDKVRGVGWPRFCEALKATFSGQDSISIQRGNIPVSVLICRKLWRLVRKKHDRPRFSLGVVYNFYYY